MTTPDEPPPAAGDQPRRQRAPTITIDTSAVSTPPAADDEASQQPMALRPQMVSRSGSEASNSSNVDAGNASAPRISSTSNRSQGSAPEFRSHPSFEGSERPTSPHNVSSPTSKSNDKPGAFLSVPGRERQGSVDSDEASYGGETYVQNGGSSSDRDREHMDNDYITKDKEALTPDPGTEEDFQRENNKFAFTPGQLNKLINPKSLAAFFSLGGLDGLEKGLRTNRDSGLSVEETFLEGTVTVDNVQTPALDGLKKASRTGTSGSHHSKKGHDLFSDRKRVFQDNRLPEKKGKSIFEIMWITYNDKVLILLSIAALVSLAVGLYQSFGQKHNTDEPRIEWLEGVAIIVAIVIVVVVGSVNDYQKERQFVKLNKKKQDRDVKVIRSGKSREISVFDILVGDVVLLEPGDMVPVDGIFIEGHNVKCDESSATGESDIIKKRPANEVYEAIKSGQDTKKLDPFILSGAHVTEGVGRFIVTSTGVNSSYGKIMMSLREDPEVTPLQSKLNVLAEYIAKLGGAAGLLLFVVLFIKFLAQLPHNQGSASEKGQQFLSIFIVTVTIIVVAVPEGLPLAVTLALAFATTRMLKDNNLVRHLKACEVMGNATAICSDKTGTLTQNKMQVVAGTIGTSSRFGGTTEPNNDEDNSSRERSPPDVLDNISAKEVAATLGSEVQGLLRESIAINSTAFEGLVDGEQTFIGSKTETALLIFAKEQLGLGPVSEERSNANTLQFVPFDSGRKCMGVVISTGDGKARLLVKGASEILLDKCSRVIRDPTQGVEDAEMTAENRKTLNNLITSYAERSLRTIGLIYRDFEQWPPKNARRVEGENDEVLFEDVFKDMTLLSIVGIQDPLREGVREAVEVCQKAGVVVRMVTGDNLTTAKAIAADCGIFTPGGIVMEGPTFRKLTKKQMDQIIPSLQVLARSSPEDKRILVKRLKYLGETVAVTGDGTNDAPALKGADVGFSMGIAGTEVAKEASAIILMDDNFASIVKAMMWGRAVNDAVKKFLQFQITVNITAVVVTFVTAVSSATEKSALTAVQLLWVNLIMDTMAALALATDPPTRSILDRKPEPKSAPLISLRMWKMIIGEAIYQLVITFMLYFGAANIFSYNTPPDPLALNAPPAETQLVGTLVFNTFVWMQIFNQWNNRRLDNKFNIFEGVQNNYFFIGINIIMVSLQVLIIFVGGKAFSVERLDARGWGYSIAFGFLSIPIGAAIRCIPDELVRKFIPTYLLRPRETPELTIEDEEEQMPLPQPLVDVKEELSFLKKMKGGRINNLRFKVGQAKDNFISRSRSGSRSRSNSTAGIPQDGSAEDGSEHPPTTAESRKRGRAGRSRSNSALGATAVMAGIIAGSVAGWSPIERPQDEQGWGRGRVDLENTPGVELHPATRPSDNVIMEEPLDTEAELPPSQREEAPHPRPASEGSEESEGKGDKDTKP
ncbi:hypothetical protein VF21_01719 [Pseudogymnoascus sp. 05NY08]|nr:hypothetical protein VF21_01719 [Pseudogymnoascus sp. 05NY08]